MSTTTRTRVDSALLVLRLAGGGIMIAHGLQKLLVFGFAGIIQGFTQQGVPMPTITGPFITFLEVLAPIAIIFGFLARLAAFGLLCDMLGAITFVHFKNGFFSPTGFEFPLSLACIFLTLVIAGAGAYSIDGSITRRRGPSAP
ncbi:MAG TPA: DoxX family protein [Gemmatimonadaceae bacterium]|jgi:putative oxidoreductase